MAVLARVLVAALLATSLMAPSVAALGADNQWSQYGTLPPGAPVFGLASDPATATTVFAATMGAGLLRTDDGRTWAPVAADVLPQRLWKVAIDAANGPGGAPPIYVGSAGGGFFKSLDGGKTFKAASGGLNSSGSKNVRSIALGRGAIVIGTSDGVYRTQDGGANWQSIGLAGADVSAVAYAQLQSPAVVIAGIDGASSQGSRLLRSKDDGATWQPLTKGLPQTDPPNAYVVTALAAGRVPADANLRPLFMAGGSGLFKSDDGGDNWGQLSGLPPQGFGAVVTSPIDPNTVYAASDAPPPPPGTPTGAPGTAGGGVWRSTDRGSTWTALTTGLDVHAVTAITVGRNSPATVIAVAWDTDKPAVVPYSLSDITVAPSGQPETGSCPENPCEGVVALATPTAGPTSSPTPPPCPTPGTALVPSPASPSPSVASASPGSPAPSGSPSAATARSSAVAAPAPSCPSGGIHFSLPPRHDLPLGLGAAVVGLLVILLIARLVIARR